MKYYFHLVLTVLIILLWNAGTAGSKTSFIHYKSFMPGSACIDLVMKIDDSLGRVRNHASETQSLNYAIKQYARGLAKINYRDCPGEFTNAFKAHRKAWLDMMKVTNKYDDLRGEMHQLFKQIEVGKDSVQFKVRLDEIWRTWDIVEKSKDK